jgi:hypothetical protein
LYVTRAKAWSNQNSDANWGKDSPFFKKRGLYFSQGIVWDKRHAVLTRKDSQGSSVNQIVLECNAEMYIRLM